MTQVCIYLLFFNNYKADKLAYANKKEFITSQKLGFWDL